jgi:uncharacterized membrane protein
MTLKKFSLRAARVLVAIMMITSTFVGLTMFTNLAGASLSSGDITVTPDSSLKSGRPMDLITFTLTYKNRDDDDDAYLDNFSLTPSFAPSTDDWNSTISFSGTRLRVPRGGDTGEANLFIRVAKNATHNTNKQFTVKCDVETLAGANVESVSTTVTVNVAQKHDLTLKNLTGDPDSKSPASNNRVFFNMTVSNNGNGEDTVAFSAIGSPGDAPSFTPDSSNNIPGFSNYNFRMSISNIPEDITRGDHVVTVTVTSENTSVNAQYDFIVTVDAYYELELDLNETTTSKDIQPGGDVTFNFIIYNKGNGKEKLNLDAGIIGSPDFWTTNVFPFSGASVVKNGKRDISVTVTSPINETYPTNLNVYLNVSSQNDPTVYQYTTVQVKLVQIRDLDIFVPSSKNLNGTTKTVSFPITVINQGNGEDTFEFSIIENFPSGELWTYDFSPNSITLESKYGPNNEGTVYLNFTAPDDAGYGSFQILLTAFSSSDSLIMDTDTVTIVVGKLKNIALFRLVNEKQSVYPGDNLSIKFQGENTGNFEDTFYLTMQGPTGTGNWDFEFNPGLFSNLQPDTTKIGYLNMSVDKDAVQGFYLIIVKAESATDEDKFDTFTVNVSVRRNYEVEMSTTSTTESTNPGSPATFSFTIRNRGTGSANITMNSEMTAEISGYMNVKITPKTFDLATPSAQQIVTVEVTPSDASPLAPMNISTGVPITITADIDERDGGPEETELVYVKVNQTFDVQIWPDALEKTVKPGKTINFTVEIRNTGNGPDSFSITTSSVLTSWSADLTATNTQTLDQDESEEITLTIQVPINEKQDHDNITINVSSRNAIAEGLVVYRMESITINVRSPVAGLNMSMTDGTRTKNANPGSIVKFNVTATNTGVDDDRFTFEVDYTNKEYVREWTISKTSTDILAPEATEDFQISFDLKSDAASDYINITLTGTSKNNVNTVEKFILSILVNPIFDIDVSYSRLIPRQGEDAIPGTNATFQIRIENDGTANDLIELEIEENYDDITAVLDDYTYTVGASQIKTTVMTVILPEEPDDLSISIKVTATSKKDDRNPAASDSVNVVFDIDPTRDVDVSSNDPNLELAPNIEGAKAEIDFDITVNNKGRDRDSFDMKVNVDATYSSWFSYPAESAKIDEDTTTIVTVTVEVPNNWMPETIQFTVTATSVANDAKSDTETFTLKILEAYGIDLIAVDNVDKIDLDDSSVGTQGDDRIVVFELEAINIGTSSDNYEVVEVEGADSSKVTITVSPSTVLNLPSGVSQTITVTVKVPNKADIGDIRLTIKATSRGDDTVFNSADEFDEIELWITVTQIHDVDIPNPTTSESGTPGELMKFKFSLKNHGNGVDDVLIKLWDKEDNWPWALSTTAVTLQPAGDDGSTQDITLSVVIPQDAEVRADGYSVNLTIESDLATEDNKVHIARGELSFTVTLEQDYNVKMTVTKNKLDGDPGDTVNFRITVRNNGNGRDTYDLDVTLEKSSDNILPAFETELSRSIVTLPPFEFTYVWLNVTIPDIDEISDLEDIKADTYKVSVHASSLGEEDVDYQLNLNVTINKKYKLEITADNPAPSSDPMAADADEPDGVRFFVTVVNQGNEDDTARLAALDNEPDDWDVSFEIDNTPTTTLSLEPGESQRVEVTVTFGEDVSASTDYIGITAKSTKNNKKYGLAFDNRIYIQVQIYLLNINSVELSKDPDVGDTVTVTATIENTGEGDAEDLVVTFKDGSALIKSVEVDKIDAGDTENVQVEWKVTEGDHKLKIEVDQFDGTSEDFTKTVTAETPPISSQMLTYGLAIAILLVIILAIFAAASVRRRGELPADVKAELIKLRKESEMRKARAELSGGETPRGEGVGAAAGAGATALPGVGKYKELPPGPSEGEGEAPKSDVKIKCPKCDMVQVVPSTKRPLEFECDDCGQKLVLRKK